MPLSCYCDLEDPEWLYLAGEDYSTFTLKRRKRCSCGELINQGELCLEFKRFRYPKTDIEENIYGDEVPLASMYLCEHCADLYFSFTELGFDCVDPTDNMKELVKEYAYEYGTT